MKTLKLSLILTIMVIITSSCKKGSSWSRVRGQGGNVAEMRNLNNFNSINLACNGNITYVQDSIYKVEITAQENILKLLETKVVDAELRFSFLREVWSHNDILIKVHCPDIKNLGINGSGSFNTQSLKTNNLTVYINGSGNINIATLNCNTVNSEIGGSGNITLSAGNGTTASYQITGSGNIFASGLTCKTGIVKVSGSGNITIHATDKLDVNLSGSGDIMYKGNPVINSNISGSGRLIHIN